MKRPLSSVVTNDIIDRMQLGYITQTVGYIYRDMPFDNDKESLSDVWWTIRNSVCLSTRESIRQKL